MVYSNDAFDRPNVERYSTVRQIAAVVHLNMMDVLGYFTHEGSTLCTSKRSRFGNSLYHSASLDEPWAASAVLLIELLRTGAFVVKVRGEVSMNESNCFIESVCCLIQLPEVSGTALCMARQSDMIAFCEMVVAMHRTLRNSVDVLAAIAIKCELHSIRQVTPVATALPYFTPPSIQAAMMECVLTDPVVDRKAIKERLPWCKRVDVALASLFQFCEAGRDWEKPAF